MSMSSDLEQFHQFVGEQLARGEQLMTPEECLEVWRLNHPTPDEMAESIATIEEGLAQMRRGEGTPLGEFVRRFRAEKGIPDADA